MLSFKCLVDRYVPLCLNLILPLTEMETGITDIKDAIFHYDAQLKKEMDKLKKLDAIKNDDFFKPQTYLHDKSIENIRMTYRVRWSWWLWLNRIFKICILILHAVNVNHRMGHRKKARNIYWHVQDGSSYEWGWTWWTLRTWWNSSKGFSWKRRIRRVCSLKDRLHLYSRSRLHWKLVIYVSSMC